MGYTLLDHQFRCHRCNREAGRVVLFAPGERVVPATDDPTRQLSALHLDGDAERHQLRSFSEFVDTGVASFEPEAVAQLIGTGDAKGLFALDRELLPWWCPTCSSSYCLAHWVTWVVYDDAFFDQMRGTCPKGHERRLAD